MAKKGGGKMGEEYNATFDDYAWSDKRANRARKLFTPPVMKKIIAACHKIDLNDTDPVSGAPNSDAFNEFKDACNDVLKSPADGSPTEINYFIQEIWVASKISRRMQHELKPCW